MNGDTTEVVGVSLRRREEIRKVGLGSPSLRISDLSVRPS